MNNNIEQLKTEVDDIKKSLNDLKTNVDISETEKKTKAEALKSQAETTKQKIQKEINDLSNQSGQGVESKKEEAEALLNSFNEIMSLYDSITNTGNNIPIQQQTLPETEDKGIFSKAKDRIGDQWSDVKSGDKWKSEPGKNILRTLGFGLTGYAAYKGIKALWKKIFGKKEEEEDEEEKEEKKSKKKKEEENDKEDGEKKSFRSKWYGKTIGGGAVGAGIYFLGKWLHLWGNKDNKTNNYEENKTNQNENEIKNGEIKNNEIKNNEIKNNEIKNNTQTPITKGKAKDSNQKEKHENTKNVVNILNQQNLLSHEDFVKYFEGEKIKQRNVGNCRILGAIDSLVSFGDYEKLIKSSVTKYENGFRIRLPIGDKGGKIFDIPFEKLKTQTRIDGSQSVLVDGKLGIQAILYAYGMKVTGNDTFDFLNLDGGLAVNVFNDLVSFPGKKTYIGRRFISEEMEKIDTTGMIDKNFVNQFRDVLESFDSKNDMLALSVCQNDEINNDRKTQVADNYSNLGHYSQSNHLISVEAVKKINGKLIITVSNPWDSEKSYDIPFNELLKSCSRFHLCTKKEREGLTLYDGKYETGSRKDSSSEGEKKMEDIHNVNQIVELTGEKNRELREARGDVIVSGKNPLIVESYKNKTQVKEEKGNIIIGSEGNLLSIDKEDISDVFYRKGGESPQKNDAYRLNLYGVKIANFINKIKHDYSIPDDKLLLDNGILKLKRSRPMPNGTILGDWSSLGISKDSTKMRVVKYFEKLGYKCEIKL